MRDFDVTAEPAGGSPAAGGAPLRRPAPPGAAAALRLPARGRRRAGQLGGPAGPTLDPARPAAGRARRGPPARVRRLRGRDPARAVRRRRRDRLGPRARGRPRTPTTRPRPSPQASCTSTCAGEKLRGRFVLIRRGRTDSAKEQWLLVHKNDEHARHGWTAEDHPRSVLSGRTNDEVAAGPGRAVAERRARCRGRGPPGPAQLLGAADRRRARRARRPAPQRPVDGRRATTSSSPTSTRCCSPAATASRRSPSASSCATTRRSPRCCCPTWPAGPSTCTATPTASTARLLAQGAARRRAGVGDALARPRRRARRDAECYLVADSVPTLAWLANFGAVELHPWTSAAARRPHGRPGR